MARIGDMEEKEYMGDEDDIDQSQEHKAEVRDQVKVRHREHLVDHRDEDIEILYVYTSVNHAYQRIHKVLPIIPQN